MTQEKFIKYFLGGEKVDKRKETPQERYHKKNLKVFYLPCMKSTEIDIINKLDSEPNKSGYIKHLIRQDISQEQNKQN